MSNLLHLRASAGLSQAKLAKLAGISQTLLWKLEHRTKEPKGLRTAFALAAALGVEIRDIWPEAVVARALPQRLTSHQPRQAALSRVKPRGGAAKTGGTSKR